MPSQGEIATLHTTVVMDAYQERIGAGGAKMSTDTQYSFPNNP